MNQPNQSDPVSQQQIQDPSPQESPVQTSGVSPSKELKEPSSPLLKYLLVAVCAFLLVGAGAVVTYWYMSREEVSDTEETSLEEEESTSEENEEAEEEQSESEEEEEAIDPYEGWETYTVERYSVSFRYPSSWSVELEEGPASEGPEDYTDVIVTNSESKSIVRIYVGHYFGAVAKPEVSSNGETVDVGGETYYEYTCNELGYLYYDASQNNNFERTGECYELYTELTAQKFALLPNFDSTNSTIGWFALMYGSVDREYDYVPSNEDMATALKVVESFEGL